jgi:hypothetical protein
VAPRQDEGQGHRPVEQVGAARLACALGRTRDVEHVVEHLECHAEALAEAPQRPGELGPPAEQGTKPARRLEQARRLEPAALEVSLGSHVLAPGIGPLHQLAAREGGRGCGERRHRGLAAGGGQLGERAREQQVAGSRRGGAASIGEDGRPSAAQLGGVQHVIVHERGHVQQLHRRPRGHQLFGRLGSA